MSYTNEAGEPYMTAAQLRFEAELDEGAAYDRAYDDYFEHVWQDAPVVDPSACDHDSLSAHQENGVWTEVVCDVCDTEAYEFAVSYDSTFNEYNVVWDSVRFA